MDFYAEMKKERGQVQFQQDNASCHMSKRTKNWFANHSIPLLYHSPNSPDLSPIEPMWYELKKLVCDRLHLPTTIDGLKAAVLTAWEELDVADVDKYILSMPDRAAAVLASKGGHTHYWFLLYIITYHKFLFTKRLEYAAWNKCPISIFIGEGDEVNIAWLHNPDYFLGMSSYCLWKLEWLPLSYWP
jgi:DDE superfamily endonuclease